MSRIDEKKLHTREFQLKGSGGNMRCKLLQKRSPGKTTECSKHLRYIAIEKDILSELNRCIFQITLKYIKLVIPKILFILILCSFNFYFKITWPPLPTKLPPPTKIEIPDPSPAKTFLKFLLPLRQAGKEGACPVKSKRELFPNWKNVFYFTTKALFVLEKIKF